QVLALIVQIFSAQRGSTIVIEEPETSLHPDAQLTLSELIATAVATQGLQVVLSTHSETMLMGLQAPLKSGLLKGEDIAVYQVSRTEGTTATKLALIEKGRIVGPIPTFDDAAKRLFDEMASPERISADDLERESKERGSRGHAKEKGKKARRS